MSVDVAAAAQLACLLEVSAPKPGNVSPGKHFGDTRFEDLLASAAAIGAPLAGAGDRGLGATVRLAIDATQQWTRSNTNLGIVLLLSPLARAALIHPTVDLRCAVRQVLDSTTVDDAREVYAAIRRASPGGLGTVDAQDVAGEPTATLRDVMRLAAERDGIAREYATGFDLTFTCGVPALRAGRRDGLSWDDAIVDVFLALIGAGPDTHIVRRGGQELARAVSQQARDALTLGGVRSAAGRRAIAEMDASLRREGNVANPGTSADLTAAAIFVVLLEGAWRT